MSGVDVGSMLLIPFGQRRLLGVVVELAQESDVPPERLVEPLATLESGVPAELVRLGLWVADQYCSTPARGLALVLPPGTGTGARAEAAARTRTFLTAELTDAGRAALGDPQGIRLGPVQRGALETLADGALTATQLRDAAGAAHGTLARLAERGLISLEQRR